MGAISYVQPTNGVRPREWGALPRAGTLVLLGVVYFVTGWFGLELAVVHPSATLVWAPTGVALAACLVLGTWVWPAVFLAAFLLNVATTASVWTSFAIGLGNTVEPLLGAYLVSRFANGSRSFETVRDVTFYMIFAAGLSPAVGATIGVTALSLGGLAEWTSYGPIWVTWWAGDAGSALVVAPVLLLWIFPPPMRWTRAKIVEAGAVSFAIALAGLAVFGGFPSIGPAHYPVDFLCVPFVGWAALRLSPRVSATGMLLLSAVAVWGTVNGYGPFAETPTQQSLLLLQAYIGVTGGGVLLFAATVRERRKLVQRLEEMSMLDPLTGLANYRRLTDVLEQEIERSLRTESPFAVVLFDLDGLKALNDRHGHLAGNRALCRLADALRESCRAVDTAARYGGDEFALVLPECHRSETATIVERVQRQLSQEEEPPRIFASAGFSVYPDDAATVEGLIRRADERLYRSKGAR